MYSVFLDFLFSSILSLSLSLTKPKQHSVILVISSQVVANYIGRVTVTGGERRVTELLEDESRKTLRKLLIEKSDEETDIQQKPFRNFFFRPYTLGEDLFTIEKFGLVQYVSLSGTSLPSF